MKILSERPAVLVFVQSFSHSFLGNRETYNFGKLGNLEKQERKPLSEKKKKKQLN